MIFPLVPLIFSIKNEICASRTLLSYARARALGRVPAAHAQMTSPSCDTEQMALYSPFLLGATVVMHREPKTIASRPCTPPSTLEMFCEKIIASAGSSKEIAGLLMMMMMMMMTRKLCV